MFDLIGLPVTSTGLLNHVFDQRTSSSSNGGCSKYQSKRESVVKVAIKWREKGSRAAKTGRAVDKCRRCISHSHSHSQALHRPDARESIVNEQQPTNTCKSDSNSRSWSNGKNWHFPDSSEGDWVLVYPLLLPTNNRIRFSASAGGGGGGGGGGGSSNVHRTFNTDEIRQVVSSVVSFLKIAKHVFDTNPNAVHEYFNAHMTLYLKSDAKIWAPPLQ